MKSPFSKDRFEYIPSHLYFLPQTIVSQLEDSKPTYLVGSRGSGKTTLLKSLNWQERLENKWLREALGDNPFRGEFVAAYVKIPNFKVRSLHEWLKSIDEDTYGVIFGFYMDLIAIEMLSNAVGNLIARQEWKIDPGHESSIISSFFDEYTHFIKWAQATDPSTIWQCKDTIKQIRQRLEHYARMRKECHQLVEEVLIPEIGELSRSFGTILTQLSKSDTGDLPEWHFKICFDEAECLSPSQQKVVNTLIRISQWPLSYVVSYVGWPNDDSTTMLPELSLQKADRNIIVLDDLKRSEFEDLCDGVASVRVRAATERKDVSIKTVSILGKLDLNSLVETLIRKSESPVAKVISEMAAKFSNSEWASARKKNAKAPYIEGYLASHLHLKPPEEAENDSRRRQESAEYRKKIVAAYLAICRDLNVSKIPFASADMVLGISDNCVRDYLSQMHHIFLCFDKDLSIFVESSVPIKIQERAIRDASEEKKLSIPESGVLRPILIGNIVKGLAELTARLQRGDAFSDAHLRSSERGIFILDPRLKDIEPDRELYQMIQDAGDAGFLRVFKESASIVAFRVHSSLAPAFGFSYRGAYYPVLLKRDELQSFMSCSSDSELKDSAKKISQRLAGLPEDNRQLMLFPTEVSDLWDARDAVD